MMFANFRSRAVLILILALVIVYILWNTPQFDLVLYPFRLFVTFVHEAGHGLMALVSGGRFIGFTVNSDGSGFATTAGGSRALILPAGYLGAAAFGALLFYLAHRVPYPRTITLILGGAVMIIAVLFGGFLSTAALVGVLMGLALIGIGWKANRDLNLLALNLLSILTALNAVFDLIFLVGNTGASVGTVRNDAAAFSAEVAPLIPPAVIAAFWALISVALLAAAAYYSLIAPLLRR